MRGAGQMKAVVARKEHAEHFGASDDGDRSVAGAELPQGLFERGAERIPQERIRIGRVGSKGRDLARQHQPLARARARAAFMRVPAVNDCGGAVEAVLEKMLIGIVADRCRHLAFGVGKHAVGRNDDIAFDAAQSGETDA